MDAGDFAAWIRSTAGRVSADAERLTRLDAAIGDGDHGLNLDRGFRAAVEALPEDAPPGKVLIVAAGPSCRRQAARPAPLRDGAAPRGQVLRRRRRRGRRRARRRAPGRP
ncbi:hypothetical protein ACFQY7_33650 [Actinomadura luteofluorescens]|uniref:hypothetical protein n=1 Tax=Actinomadura luteofluorescens TaxID=46163 RepID=UPI003638DD1D